MSASTPSGVLLQDTDLDGIGDDAINAQGYPAFGSFGDQNFNSAAGISFTLPSLPAGEFIDSITFTAFNEGNQGVSFNADVYGIRSSSDPAWITSDYGIGPSQTGTLLQDNWALSIGTYLSEIDVTSWVGTGYTEGNTVFFRIAADADTATVANEGRRAWFLGADQSNPPVMTITTSVPEPSTWGIGAGLGVLGLAILRRLRR